MSEEVTLVASGLTSPPNTVAPVKPRTADTNGFGVAGFVCSLVGVVLACFGGFVLSPLGLILSACGMRREPRGLAIAGLVLGIIGSVCLIYSLMFMGSAMLVGGTATGLGAAARELSRAARPAQSDGVATLAAFERVHEGMSYQQVVDIIGGKGKELSRSSLAGTTMVIYMWDGHGGFGANMNAMFQNDRLISKSQINLE